MKHRHAPRRLSLAIGSLADDLAPRTPLAEVQRVWPEVVGAAVAREATPIAERAGVLTVSCRSSVWAQELELMAPELVERLNAALGSAVVQGLRCQAATSRSWARG
ncbi:MAG: DUF721 domain-containing protein [Solirubrobacterales bacterium]|nr:DUF721 domain-containing protein [Solirubrobacterales bacterium]